VPIPPTKWLPFAKMLSYVVPSTANPPDRPNPFKPEDTETDLLVCDEGPGVVVTDSLMCDVVTSGERIDCDDKSPYSENRSIVSDGVTTPGFEEKSKGTKPPLKR